MTRAETAQPGMTRTKALAMKKAHTARVRLFVALLTLFGVMGTVAAVHIVFALKSYAGA